MVSKFHSIAFKTISIFWAKSRFHFGFFMKCSSNKSVAVNILEIGFGTAAIGSYKNDNTGNSTFSKLPKLNVAFMYFRGKNVDDWGEHTYIHLVSMIMIFVGTVWNTRVRGDLAQNMAARVFQGLGWGAFDTLVLGSIQDTYFVSAVPPVSIQDCCTDSSA